MNEQPAVSQQEWLTARKELLAKEKEFTRLRDELSAERRNLPWVKIDKEYIFEGENGEEKLTDLFGDKSQLMIYHFMLGQSGTKDVLAVHFERITSMGLISISRIETYHFYVYPEDHTNNFLIIKNAWVGALNGYLL